MDFHVIFMDLNGFSLFLGDFGSILNGFVWIRLERPPRLPLQRGPEPAGAGVRHGLLPDRDLQ